MIIERNHQSVHLHHNNHHYGPPEAQASIVLNLLHHLLNHVFILLTHRVLVNTFSGFLAPLDVNDRMIDLKHVVDGVVRPEKQVSVKGARAVWRLKLKIL